MPVDTPKASVDAFHETVFKVLAMTDIKATLANLGFEQADTAKENFI